MVSVAVHPPPPSTCLCCSHASSLITPTIDTRDFQRGTNETFNVSQNVCFAFVVTLYSYVHIGCVCHFSLFRERAPGFSQAFSFLSFPSARSSTKQTRGSVATRAYRCLADFRVFLPGSSCRRSDGLQFRARHPASPSGGALEETRAPGGESGRTLAGQKLAVRPKDPSTARSRGYWRSCG